VFNTESVEMYRRFLMTMNRRQFNRSVLALLAASALLPLVSVAADELLEGRDWRRIDPPQPSDTPNKIEVLEFFSYGCPHCSDLNELIKPWAHNLAADVVFRRLPVTFGRSAWVNLAKFYFTLETTDQLGQLDQLVFNALHKQHLKLFTVSAMLEWLQQKGADGAQFKAAFESFDVQTRLNRSEALASRYQIDAVPTIIVAGRYAVLGGAAKTQADLLTIADSLIVKARADLTSQ
jgi:protein dithiol oxidoreductase (disulfide-forming)